MRHYVQVDQELTFSIEVEEEGPGVQRGNHHHHCCLLEEYMQEAGRGPDLSVVLASPRWALAGQGEQTLVCWDLERWIWRIREL